MAAALARVRERVEGAAKRAGREPFEIVVVGVAKRQPAERVAAAVRAGLRDVGESYVQEAGSKIPQVEARLEGRPGPRWHLVGRLQRNKAREAVRRFQLVHSVDRLALARELARHVTPAGRLEVLLQVDLSGEPQKGGVDPDALPELLAGCAALPELRVSGLMTIPAAAPDPESSRSAFARLRALRDRLAASPEGRTLRELSMGMSQDYEVAIEEGATMVRIGTAIFGPRETGS